MTHPRTIVLEVLTASREDHGQLKKLSFDLPCKFENANGDLRGVDRVEEVRKIASISAGSFLDGLRKSNVI